MSNPSDSSSGDEDELESHSQAEEEDLCEAALACKVLYSVKLPAVLPGTRSKTGAAGGTTPGAKQKPISIASAAWHAPKQRLYVGLSNGDLCFWVLDRGAATQLRHVGTHKGPVSCICLPKPADGELGAASLILSGSVDGNIKIWDYQGKVASQPTVCVQTLYGHTGTVTGLVTYGHYIVSSSTDGTIRVWKAVEGRAQLVYPWYNLQATPVALSAWVRHMCYDRSREVGDLGSFFAADESGGILRIMPQPMQQQLDADDNSRIQKGFTFGIPGYHGSASSWPNGPAGAACDLPHAIQVTHDRGVLLLRYVADWHLLLTLCYDNCLRAYDSDTSELKHAWDNENKCLFLSLEVNQEHREILTGDQQGVLSIYSLRAGALLATKRVASTPIINITAVISRHVYAVMTEREVSVLHLNHDLGYNLLRGGHTKAVLGLYACTGGTGAQPTEQDYRILSAGADNTVRLWDPYDMSCARVLSHSGSEITAITFYEAWHILVTGHNNGDIRLWDLDTGPWCTLQQHTNTVSSLVMALVHKNEELLISGGYDGLVVLWDIRTIRNEPPHMVAQFRAHGLEPQKAPSLTTSAAQAASALVMGCHAQGGLIDDVREYIPALTPLYDVSVSSLSDASSTAGFHSMQPQLNHSTMEVRPHNMSDTQLSQSGAVQPQPTAPRHLLVNKGRTQSQSSMPCQPASGQDQHHSATAAGGHQHQASSTLRRSMLSPDPAAACNPAMQGRPLPETCDLTLIDDGAWAAADIRTGTVDLSNIATSSPRDNSSVSSGNQPCGQAKQLNILDVLALEPEVQVVTLDPLKKVIITAGNDRTIKVWSMSGHMQLGQHLGHTEAVMCLALDANLLFSGSEDCSIRVWDTVPAATSQAGLMSPKSSVMKPPSSAQARPAAGQQADAQQRSDSSASRGVEFLGFTSHGLKVLTGHTGAVTGLEVQRDGGHIISCSLDGSLRLWDYVTGATLYKFTHHEEMRCLALRRDKPEVLVGSQQASILRYSVADVPAVGGYMSGGAMLDLETLTTSSAQEDGAAMQDCTAQATRGVVASLAGSQRSVVSSQATGSQLDALQCAATSWSDRAGIPSSRTSVNADSACDPPQGAYQGAQCCRCPSGSSTTLTEVSSIGAGVTARPTPGRLFGNGEGGGGGALQVDPWRWGAAKVQLLPKQAPKLSAEQQLALLNKQAAAQR